MRPEPADDSRQVTRGEAHVPEAWPVASTRREAGVRGRGDMDTAVGHSEPGPATLSDTQWDIAPLPQALVHISVFFLSFTNLLEAFNEPSTHHTGRPVGRQIFIF